MEVWKDIKGYEGKYQVSNTGKIKSLNYKQTNTEQILQPGIKPGGYLYVNLSQYGKYTTYRIHRLVAEAFIPNPDNLPQVNHKDEDKTNNNVNNLEWCTAKYNLNYGLRAKNYSVTRGIPVKCIETRYNISLRT